MNAKRTSDCKRRNGVAQKHSCIITLCNPTNHAGIKRSVDFIARNCFEPITMSEVIRVSGLGRRGFYKAFEKSVGVKPAALLRNIRIEYAKKLLVEHDLILKQIAAKCGYRSENTFCVAFQRATHVSPKKFQRQYWLTLSQERQTEEHRTIRIFSPHVTTGRLDGTIIPANQQ